jgi:hypothetical protein
MLMDDLASAARAKATKLATRSRRHRQWHSCQAMPARPFWPDLPSCYRSTILDMTFNQEVMGSNPIALTNKIIKINNL